MKQTFAECPSRMWQERKRLQAADLVRERLCGLRVARCCVLRPVLQSSLNNSGSDVEKMEKPPVIDFTARLPPLLLCFFPLMWSRFRLADRHGAWNGTAKGNHSASLRISVMLLWIVKYRLFSLFSAC